MYIYKETISLSDDVREWLPGASDAGAQTSRSNDIKYYMLYNVIVYIYIYIHIYIHIYIYIYIYVYIYIYIYTHIHII